MKIGLVIFTRNERKNSERIYSKIPFNIFDKTYVVDGNSTDGTQEFWKSKKIKVLGQKYKGVGGAYESAFANTKEDALVFFHPDGNADPKSLSRIVRILRIGGEIVIPSRMIKGSFNEEDGQLFKPRKWVCQILGLIANIIWGRDGNWCSDITQGFRGISRDGYQNLKIKIPDPIAPDYEQIIRALKYKVRICEFPTREGRRVHGETSFQSYKTGKANLRVLLRELGI